jgi:hypothetical protein
VNVSWWSRAPGRGLRIFEVVPPPRRRDLGCATGFRWLTWSPRARTLLEEIERRLPSLTEPRLVRLRRAQRYSSTFSAGARVGLPTKLWRDVIAFGDRLTQFNPADELFFVRGLITDRISARAVHYLFAVTRDAIAGQSGKKWAALYTPLTTATQGEFPLHSDLYVPEILFNVFDEVPCDGSGTSVFLPVHRLFELLEALPSLPVRRAAQIRSRFTTRFSDDQYDWLYDDLHGDQHPWTRELERKMAEHQIEIPFARGEGYLLHDRRWLHGRTAPSGTVSSDRVHRLIFDVR